MMYCSLLMFLLTTQKNLLRWKQLLDWGLVDLGEEHIPEGEFTLWDYRRGAFQRNMGMRIDHFLGTYSMVERVESAADTRFSKKEEWNDRF